MKVSSLQHWINHPEELNKESLYELRTLLARYPYCQSIRLLYLKNLYLLHDITFGAELRKSAFYVADRRVLFYLIEGDKFLITGSKKGDSIGEGDWKEEEPGLDRTLALIDAFLAASPNEELGGLDYALDYTTYLTDSSSEEKQTDVPKLRGQELIDGFIAKAESEPSMKLALPNEEDETEFEAPSFTYDEEDEEDTCFTETLAQIYIKQRRYSKALEIIKKLSLKYPKKNAYFADQIRFLEKLIINAKS